jgi:hypothetical protein
MIEIGSPRVRLVLTNLYLNASSVRRAVRAAAAAESVSLDRSTLQYCNAFSGEGGCVHLPAGTRLSCRDCGLGFGAAARGALIAMATGPAPQKGGAPYLSISGEDFISFDEAYPQTQGAIFIRKETPSPIEIKVTGLHIRRSVPAAAAAPAACAFLVTERWDANPTTGAEGGAITLQVDKLNIERE